MPDDIKALSMNALYRFWHTSLPCMKRGIIVFELFLEFLLCISLYRFDDGRIFKWGKHNTELVKKMAPPSPPHRNPMLVNRYKMSPQSCPRLLVQMSILYNYEIFLYIEPLLASK